MFRRLRRNTTDLSDESLVQRYQQEGDLSDLGLLYERYVELVYGVCLKYLKESTKAEDAVMAVFETLVEKVKTQDIRQFRPWLHVVAKNHCLMQLRKKDILVALDEMPPSVQAGIMHSDDFVHPLDAMAADEQGAVLKNCLERLSAQQKHCVEQFYFENRSYREIADMTGEELGMVRSNIQNGRRNLRICMERNGSRESG